MFGKAALILVVGFSMIFLIAGKNFGSLSSRAVENACNYYIETEAHNLAVSGANLAANQLFLDNSWTKGFDDIEVEDGSFNVEIQIVDALKNIKKIVSTGVFLGVAKKVEVIIQPSKFSKFAYMSEKDPTNLYWSNKDTIWGPFHQQNDINAYRHPVFMGKATTNGKVKYYESQALDEPYFNGGFEAGVDLKLPNDGVTNLESAASTGGKTFNNTISDTIYLTFASDSIRWKKGYNNPETVESATNMAPNGVIFGKKVTFRIKGIVKGQYTISSDQTIYLDDNIVYKTDPRTDPESTDLLGIVSKQNVLIAKNAANTNDINIDASIYAEGGGFGAGWDQFTIDNGKINLYGGIQNKTRVQIGVINGGNLLGFSRNYKYDERLRSLYPPFYPGTGGFEIVSWYE